MEAKSGQRVEKALGGGDLPALSVMLDSLVTILFDLDPSLFEDKNGSLCYRILQLNSSVKISCG
jgi:hypothetical protein